MKDSYRVLAALLMGLASGASLAGPPLAIDDPGVLDPGGFEYILSLTTEGRTGGDGRELPALELTYGIGTDVQATVAIRHSEIDPDAGASKSGLGVGELNVKWRFIDTDKLQVALSPAYAFNLSDGSVNRGIADDVDDWVIPVDVEYDFGNWRLGAEISYSILSGSKNAWGYGIAAYLPVRENVDLMLEFYGDTEENLNSSNSAVHLGAEIGLGARTAALFSIGTGLADADGTDEFELDVFLGVKTER